MDKRSPTDRIEESSQLVMLMTNTISYMKRVVSFRKLLAATLVFATFKCFILFVLACVRLCVFFDLVSFVNH